MIVTILNQKYRIGSNRGMGYYDNPQALEILNKVIDWDNSHFPEDPKTEREEEVDVTDQVMEVLNSGFVDKDSVLASGVREKNGKFYKTVKVRDENRKYLGDIPELKPGNMLVWENQVIAIDSPSRLVLCISESGPLALERIWEETIYPKYLIQTKEVDEGEVFIEEVSEMNARNYESVDFEKDENWISINLPYGLFKNIISEESKKALIEENRYIKVVADFYYSLVMELLIVTSSGKAYINCQKSDITEDINDSGQIKELLVLAMKDKI